MSPGRQVVHVLSKDLRRFGPALVGMGALMLVHTTGRISPSMSLQYRLPLPLGIVPLLLAALTAVVVQEDGPASDRAFLSTRPLSGGALLGAKLTFVVLFLSVVPVALQAAWFHALDAQGSLAGASLDSSVEIVGFLLMIAAAASVTRSIRGFLALALATWVGISLLRSATDPFDVGYDQGVVLTRRYLTSWAWVAVGLGLVGHQYLSRRTLRTIALGVVSIAAVVVVIPRLAVDLSTRTDDPIERVPYPDADAIELRIFELSTVAAGRPDLSAGHVGVEARIGDSDPDVLLRLVRSEVRLLGEGYDRSFAFGPGMWSRSPLLGGPVTALPDLRPAGRWARLVPDFNELRPLIAEAPADGLATLRRADRLQVTITADAFATTVHGALPLGVGASLVTPAGVHTIRAVHRRPRSIAVEVEHRQPLSRALEVRGEAQGEVAYVLRNGPRREYLPSLGGDGIGAVIHRLVGGTGLVSVTARAEFTERVAGGDASLPEDWFREVELLVVGPAYRGTLTRSITRDIPSWPEFGELVRIDPRPER